jgi:uncharacterized protein (DUF1800 family)
MNHSFLRRFSSAIFLGVMLGWSAALGDSARLINLSTTGMTSPGTGNMVTGFVIGPGAGESVLLRAVGPTLQASFGIAGALADPVLTLTDKNGNLIATNSAWVAADAGAMTAAGAFPLIGGSHDCDLTTTLAAGTYTASVSPASGDTGITLLEIYEINATATSSPLINLSNRLIVGTGSASATNGLIIGPGTGSRTLLLRAVGPTLGTAFGLSGVMANPTLTLTTSTGTVLATNDDWGTPVGAGAATAAQLSAAFTASGAFALPAGSQDAAIIATLATGNYTMKVTGVGGSTGMALVEVYDLTPSGPTTVSVAATSPSADTGGNNPGVFTFSRTGDVSQPLTLAYTVGGTAVGGTDYTALPGVITIPAGASTAAATVNPMPKLSGASATVIATLASSSGYAIDAGVATITITTVPATLYVARLEGASGSTASGTSTIFLAPDGSSATVNIAFSGLSSTENVAHLVIGTPGSGTFVDLTVPYGQVSGLSWTFTPSGPYSSADLLAALENGQIFVEIDTQNYPSGELTGSFVLGAGSQTFTAPGAAPAIDLANVAPADAARFLAQATFGATSANIAAVTSQGYSTWIADQRAITPSSHLAATREDAAAYPNTGQFPITSNNRQEAWWAISVTGQDQLRQRVAFALSEIFVVSDVASALTNQPEALANYYDLLAGDAFGNYRTLLQDVTLSPVMGNYLNMLRSAAANAAKGTSADENYARELMQLFTIGLNQLNPDGTLTLDSTGLPIPTYDQATIVQTANVLTGWSYHSTLTNPSFSGGTADWYNPMQLFPAQHDNTQKTIVGGVIIPPSQGGATDLKILLDTLFNHPNAGPFFARGLIQHLVTSNPSPGYVYRVASVFANDGSGTRGNLAAVVQAVLTDYEARSPAMLTNASFGKLKEPLLRQTALYRAFNGRSSSGRWGIAALFTPDTSIAQAALRSPTVFNFFPPDFVLPGPLAQAGLYAPEFQITTAATAITVPNYLYNSIYTAAAPSAVQPVLDLSALTSAADTTSMVGLLNLLLAGGNMSASAQSAIIAAVNGLPSGTTALAKAQYALYLAATTSSGAVQQ